MCWSALVVQENLGYVFKRDLGILRSILFSWGGIGLASFHHLIAQIFPICGIWVILLARFRAVDRLYKTIYSVCRGCPKIDAAGLQGYMLRMVDDQVRVVIPILLFSHEHRGGSECGSIEVDRSFVQEPLDDSRLLAFLLVFLKFVHLIIIVVVKSATVLITNSSNFSMGIYALIYYTFVVVISRLSTLHFTTHPVSRSALAWSSLILHHFDISLCCLHITPFECRAIEISEVHHPIRLLL